MDIEKAIRAVVTGEFEDAAKAFNTKPLGDNWARLTNAMWARQAIAHSETMAEAAKILPGLGVGHWVKYLREMHEGGKAQKGTS